MVDFGKENEVGMMSEQVESHARKRAMSTVSALSTVEPVITHTCRWKEKCMGYHRLWVFKDSTKKNLKLQVSAKYVSKLPLYD